MIASLPMYDRAETRAANDRLWTAIRAHLAGDYPDAPARLARGGDPWDHWQSPDLLFSQTCGMPYRARLHGTLVLVAAPVCDLPCPPGRYFSVFVARRDDPRDSVDAFDGAALAYNDPLSQSGWAAPMTHAAAAGLALRPGPRTGSHRASAQAVADGAADLAALDALSWRMIERWDPSARRLRPIGRTDATPALPYVTAAGRDPEPLRAALVRGLADLSAADRDCLGLRGAVAVSAEDYLAVPTPPAPAPPD